MRKAVFLSLFLLQTLGLFAQENETFFRQSGKIYVVVAVLSLILVGIVLFLIRLDRKISKLEKESK